MLNFWHMKKRPHVGTNLGGLHATDEIPWAREYGDDEHWGRFAGRFVGYDPCLISPVQKGSSDKPTVLLMADSIFGGKVWKRISRLIGPLANLSYIQHPHHAGNIDKWLNVWGIEEWVHYKILFNFEGMHGFPPRQTIDSHKKDIQALMKKYKTIFPIVIWGNMTPVPRGFVAGNINTDKGPNSIEQDVRDDVVEAMNKNIAEVAGVENIPVVNLYELIKNNPGYQPVDDLHMTPRGCLAIADTVANSIKNACEFHC